ncbi:DEAD/DEAH box helicase family protein [Kocuria rhizophila]|uniref:DUF4145 domain-containing protein n=1 Tax=Kocuria rhizophila TaxID=72000 RepID=A0AAX2SBC8_KOCRH|nr:MULTISPECIES: DEAD/DEAH box helicase family protein [Kocuria]MXN62654.1 DUF4145 domain-containing protein [Bacillus sp. BGMRC0062]WIW67742.1 DEAD/DEAH box helicase family protein [Kocuria sp. ChxB]MCR4525362.1 DEAD/DEAH box helicase family protein [Kocuria rhizophila]MCT1545967.1 DEAD/DEAH box helicase family protein [Kocuria rhizophila]MCT2170715.1 DEAD/DEAH box helicase family protein [Kocuria rhizophila]
MGNFDFMRAEWPELYEDCARAESYVMSDPRSACFYSRRAIEVLVGFLFDMENLREAYASDLAARTNDSAFVAVTGPAIQAKLNLIRKNGNTAVHRTGPISRQQSLPVLKELHHVMIWAALRYTRHPDTVDPHAVFDPQVAAQAAPLTREQVVQLAQKFKDQDAKYQKLLKERDDLAAQQQATIEELQAAVRAGREVPVARDDRDLNENETRATNIDTLLFEAGWELSDPRDREFTVSGMPTASGTGRVDYVLWGTDGRPLAIVEAKASHVSLRDGQHQAKLYADALEREHGRRPVIFLSNGYEHEIWDDAAGYPPRRVQGFYTRDELELAIQRRGTRAALAQAPIDESIAGFERPYQTRAIRAVDDAFDRKQRAALLVMATGSGKTRTAIALVKQLQEQNWAKNVLFLADRTALVRQAKRAFAELLTDTASVNLVDERHGTGRVYLSTYPTMLNLIHENEGGVRRFGPGFFDLVIVDEAHRSVYQKYRAIFEHFDSLLLGLTATPKDDIDHNTYQLFALEDGVPTDAYTLEEAVADGKLVPPRGKEISTGFIRRGMRYHERTEEERERWDEIDWGEGEIPDEVSSEEINRVLFNTDTVDKVLATVMESGHRVANGDRLGKTIIFARNQRHAEFIQERFDAQYPGYGGRFASVITHGSRHAQSLIDNFSDPEKEPHIAISVDMLDTGVDVPDVVNLVFFKPVRSKTKFWQMIGRGTRLRPDLFGPGRDKEDFLVFDCCGNLDFFNQDLPEPKGSVPKSLSQRIVEHRVRMICGIDSQAKRDHAAGDLRQLREDTASSLQRYVLGMNRENVLVRPHLRLVERFGQPEAWQTLDESSAQDVVDNLAGLPSSEQDPDVDAKSFDLLVLRYQVALLDGDDAAGESYRARIQEIAEQLRGKDKIPAVQKQLEILDAAAGDEWWQDVTLPMLDVLRQRVRGLVGLIEKTRRNPVYTDFQDTLEEIRDVELQPRAPGTDLARFEQKARAFLTQHMDHVAIERLRRNKPLTAADLASLEEMMIEHGVGDRDALRDAAERNQGMGLLIRKLVGMERVEVSTLFAEYLNDSTHTVEQIRFIERVIDELTRNGAMEPGRLYEPPFTDIAWSGPEVLFEEEDVDRIIDLSTLVRRRAVPAEALPPTG